MLNAKEVADRIRWRLRADRDATVCDLLEDRGPLFAQEVAEALWEMVQNARSVFMYRTLGMAYAMVKDMAD